MTELQFRQIEPVSDSQWIILSIICGVLIGIYLLFKHINGVNRGPSNNVKRIGTTAISKTAVVHEFHFKDQKYLVFESKNGVVELQGSPLEEKRVESNDS
ncbi:hypothetical protein J8L98_14890 [Pseudoalteromonas sp. MMG013]|uniref:hypothetical protein n=1 Tax=Pseudoalteromonas sp. MMG013 TaxID=2822687 RepID=UPI001B39B1B0|nr:hypothetical protein [Pseudoalteromonas sp. MMG013]MBQ4862972.1 hypothetical protein [Pseudoalteromonas sp. MMG013]